MEALTPVKVIRKYEGIVLVKSDAADDQQKDLFKKNSDIIKKFDGELNHLDTWGRRRLANPIDKKTHALYFHTTFTATPDCVAELERTMRIDDRVLRFMHTRLDDRTDLNKHLDAFKESLAESAAREREREAKFQKKKAARAAAGGGRKFSRDRSDKPERSDRESSSDESKDS